MWRREPMRGAQRREPPRPRSAYALSQRRAETRAVLAHDANLLRAALRAGGGGGAKTSGGTRMAQTGEHTRRRKKASSALLRVCSRHAGSATGGTTRKERRRGCTGAAASKREQAVAGATGRQLAPSRRARFPRSTAKQWRGHLRAHLQMQPTKQAKVGARVASSAVGG